MPQQESESKPTSRELLELEYRECNAGYHARDALVQDQFYKMVQTFSIFVTVLLAFRVIINVGPAVTPLFRLIFLISMGLTGLLALFAIMSDLQSNASCKIAIRKHARHVEELLFSDKEAGLWKTLESRDRYTEESIIKRMVKDNPKSDKNRHEPEKGVFVLAARLLIILWVVIVGSVIML
jgi:hypothetical protein